MRACQRYAQSILRALLGAGLLVASQHVKAEGTCKADVVFLMDNTGSMGRMISNTRRNARTILDAISGGDSRFKGIDVRYGVATYWGDPREHSASSGYHCPTSPEYRGRYNRISLNRGVTYFLDMIDTWGDGWHGNVWRLRRGSTVYADRGATFRWGRYMSGGTFTVPVSGTYNVDITPYRPWGNEIRWRVCASGSSSPSTGYREIARKAFKVNQPLTSSKSSVISGMNEWSASGGGDWPEANYFALHQLATEGGMTDGKGDTDKGYASGYRIGWREDAGKVIAWFGDAPSHCSTVNATEALNALAAKNIVVAGINTARSGEGLDSQNWWGANCERVNQADHITKSTGGTLTNNVSGSAATVKAILDAVEKGLNFFGTAAPMSFSTRKLTTDTLIFQTRFNTEDWSGDLLAYGLKKDGSIGNLVWSAAKKLDAQGPGSRTIYTLGNQRGKIVGVPFIWGHLTQDQQNDLRTEPNGALGKESKGTTRLQYLRGNRAHEGGEFDYRVRGSVLGDIVHSSAVYVGAPDQRWPDGGAGFPSGDDRYSAFRESQSTRTPVVYVGSNDGFLHGFRASDGEELVAYAPANLFSTSAGAGYHRLTQPNYSHQPLFVDGTPTISDAFIEIGTQAQWRTVLVGIEGGGGRGLFALDVTDPKIFQNSSAKDVVLWEFTNQHDAHMGYTYSEPTIVLMNNGRWAAITGNGLNDTATDATGGQAQLFIIYLDGGIDGVWTEGKDYLRIPTGVGSPSDRNGLFTPAVVDLDGNGTADRVYAGDLKGHLWAFDLSGLDQTAWGNAYGPEALFTGDPNQPITVEPAVAKHPTVDNGAEPNLMVYFGTGRFFGNEDKSFTEPQSFYGIWDADKSKLTRADLAAQSFRLNDPEKRARVMNHRLHVDYESLNNRQYGWYIDLPTKGERVISRAQISGDIVFFNTAIPDISVCSANSTGWEMAVNMTNGSNPSSPIFDFNNDGSIRLIGDTFRMETPAGSEEKYEDVGAAGRKIEEGQGMPTAPSIIGNRRYTPNINTTKDQETAETLLLGIETTPTGRLSWEQLFPD